MNKVVVIGGPSGSGKDSVARALTARFENVELMVTATTRAMRPGEQDGVNYHFFTNAQFQDELAAGNILEYYHRPETDTYYGTYKPDIEARLARGKVVLAILQIVGAKYFKEHYGATTVFIMPPSIEALERRIRGRAPMSDREWEERREFTERELREEAPWYDHRVINEEGKLGETVDAIVRLLEGDGYILE
ncbi:MAG TPA: guanylate kinase [Candidatus Paceibacterota bacterium]